MRLQRAVRQSATALVLFLALFAIANSALRTWALSPLVDACTFAALLAVGVVAFLFSRRLRPRLGWSAGSPEAPIAEMVLFLCLALATCTTYIHHGGYFFLLWPLGGHTPTAILRCRLIYFLVLAAILSVPFGLVRSRKWVSPALAVLFVLGEILAARGLLMLTDGWAVYSDDHPSFLFRLQEFWHSFPWRENYVPFWNAGVANSVLTSSGVPGYALLTAPLRLFFHNPHEYHTYGLLLVHAVIVPWITLWAFHACRVGWRTAWTGALLVLLSNRAFFLWTFHFGTVGAGVAWAMAPAAFLFLFAVAELRRTEWHVLLGLVFAFSFLCLWPQMWITAAILALAALTSFRRWRLYRRTFFALLFCAVAVLLILSPSLVSVAGGKDLLQYTTERPEKAVIGAAALWQQFLRHTSDLVLKTNPLVLVFGLAGIWTLPRRPLRRWTILLAIGIAAVYTVGPLRAPNMQLHRMVIPLALLLAVPAAFRLGMLWRDARAAAVPLQGAALALLVLGIFNVGRLYHGEGNASFRPLPPFVQELSSWVSENVPENHRFLFAGRTIHAFGRGHVAYLPVLAGREMMACDYYEFPPGTYEADFPPRAARSLPGGLHEYMVRHGVSHVVTYRPNYVRHFEERPAEFESVPEFENAAKWGHFRVFKVLGSHDVFLEGTGSVHADFNRLEIAFRAPAPDRAVIAYHWHDRLQADPPAQIEPVDSGTPNEAPFIAIRPNGAETVVIRYRSRF